MANKKMIVTIGISNSGKTTWAEEFIKEHPEFVNINRDDLRYSLFCEQKCLSLSEYKFSKAKEDSVSKEAVKMAKEYLSEGTSVIISDTNLKQSNIDGWKKIAEESGADFSTKVFDIEPSEAIKRSMKRCYTVPANVINQQYTAFRKLMKKPMATFDSDLPKAIICDIDGTLADCTGIRSPYDYTDVTQDKPKFMTMIVLHKLAQAGYKILITSGRDSVCREDTIKWLKQYVSFDKLFMRDEGDLRKDCVVKEELYFRHIDGKYNVELVLDDRQQVVDRWRALGLTCWQVAEGAF